MPETYYLETLYPLQDKILKTVETLRLDFYLTGGTALSRCYLRHRYSDDLDFFTNANKRFKEQCKLAINTFKKNWKCEIGSSADSFIRIFVETDNTSIKIDFVNDVPAHFGKIQKSPIFNRTDNWRNILSNKLRALPRLEAKDIADIIWIARKYQFDWETIVAEAKEKDLWIEPLEICRILSQFPTHLLNTIKWIDDVDLEHLAKQISIVHDDIFKGVKNSLSISR